MSCTSRLIFFVIVFFLFSQTNYAQEHLVGASMSNSIYKVEGNQIVTLKQLQFNQSPQRVDLTISNGKFWGTTYYGGDFGKGVIFSINLDGTGYKKVYDFSVSLGAFPQGGLTEFEGRLWGTASGGGINNHGVLYSIALDGSNYTVAHNFQGNDGDYPFEKLVVSNSRLWGGTSGGGSSSAGVIFSFSTGDGFQVEHDFNYSDGFIPIGDLIESNGRLWGVTIIGGESSVGVLFSIKTDGSGFRIDHHFDDSAQTPYAGLVESNGRLWGVASNGESGLGVIYSVDNNGADFTLVKESSLFNKYYAGSGSLLAFGGKLWGASMTGGEDALGLIYSINQDGTQLTAHHEFHRTGSDGRQPFCALVESNGRFWGATQTGGSYGNGVLFSIANDGTDYRIEHNFNDGVFTGYDPNSNFIDAGDRIIGSTLSGGNDDFGVIFSMRKDGSDYQITHHFNYVDGASPRGLTRLNGKIWGTVYEATNKKGLVFSVDEQGNNFKIEHRFIGSEGEGPLGVLTISDGLLCGVTTKNIFNYNTQTGVVNSVYNFEEGVEPMSGVIISNGKYWGVANSANLDGLVYSLSPDGSNYSIEHEFDSGTGFSISSPLVKTNGKIWGTTLNGVFSLDDDGNNFIILEEDLTRPYGGLVPFQGKLYGFDREKVFSFSPEGTNLEQVAAFNFTSNSIRYDIGSLVAIDFTPAPVAPSGLATETKSANSIQLSWTDNSNNETGFEIHRSRDNNAFNLIQTTAINTTSFTDEGLASATTYYYKLRSVNSGGASAFSNAVDQKTFPDPPEVPASLTATSASDSEITLKWADHSDNELGFKLYRAVGSGLYELFTTTNSNVNQFSDNDVVPATIYNYKVLAFNDGGSSAFSNEVAFEIEVTGLEDTAKGVHVYPNPFTEKIIVRNNAAIDLDIHIYNSIGVQVAKERVTAEQEKEIGSRDWAPGIYLLNAGNLKASLRIQKR